MILTFFIITITYTIIVIWITISALLFAIFIPLFTFSLAFWRRIKQNKTTTTYTSN